MRLGQLARKLALRPSQIVDYLATQQIFPEEGSNARLSDEITQHVVQYFAPERLNEIMVIEEKNEEPMSPQNTEEEISNFPGALEEEVKVELASESGMEIAEEKIEVEVIKAQKVELTGLKVLGKIDLPEPKKKSVPDPVPVEGTEESEQHVTQAEKKPKRVDRKEKSIQRREYNTTRPERNPIAIQREQRAREEEEKRKAKVERDKEKRTQYYLQRVKTGQPTKAVRIVSEPVESFEMKEVRPAPKTWLGKFLRWLNT